MRLEVALLSIPFAFCLSLFALRASIATRSSKGVSLSLRTIAYPFFICKSSLSFFLSILYQKSRDFSNVRKCRRFKSKRFKKRCNGERVVFLPLKTRKALENQGLLCVVVFSYYIDGSPCWARTNDIVINSHALYRLS